MKPKKQLISNIKAYKLKQKGEYHIDGFRDSLKRSTSSKLFFENKYEFNLPIEAIDRLIESYGKLILSGYEEFIYCQTGSSTASWSIMRGNYMLGEIEKELNRIGLDGKRFIRDTHSMYFKKDYEALNTFEKKHHNENNEFVSCEDSDCFYCQP